MMSPPSSRTLQYRNEESEVTVRWDIALDHGVRQHVTQSASVTPDCNAAEQCSAVQCSAVQYGQ